MAYQPTGNRPGRPKTKQVFIPTTYDSLTGADRLTALRTTMQILARNLIEANPTQAPQLAKRLLEVWELLEAAEVKTVMPKSEELRQRRMLRIANAAIENEAIRKAEAAAEAAS